MPDWVYGIDISYQQLDDAKCNLLELAGVRSCGQCVWTGAEQPAPRVTNLRLLKDRLQTGRGKIMPYAYASITSSRTGIAHMASARAGFPDDLFAFMPKWVVDVELPGITILQVRQAVDQVAAWGKPRDVYTSYNAWVNYLGNPMTFQDTGLWNAYWDGDPDFDYPSRPFGRWREVWAEQWSGGTNVQGVFADRDQVRADALGVVLAPPLPPITPVPTPPPAPSDAAWLAASAQADTLALLFATRQRPTAQLRETIKYLIGE
jgi:hypothetical protein